MALRPADFKSDASTYFAIRATRRHSVHQPTADGNHQAPTEPAAGTGCGAETSIILDASHSPREINAISSMLIRSASKSCGSTTASKFSRDHNKRPACAGLMVSLDLEAWVGIEPAYADLQSAA